MAADIRRRAEREASDVRREAAEWASATRREAEQYRARVLSELDRAGLTLSDADAAPEDPDEVDVIDVTVLESHGEVIDLRSAAQARGTPIAEAADQPQVDRTEVVVDAFDESVATDEHSAESEAVAPEPAAAQVDDEVEVDDAPSDVSDADDAAETPRGPVVLVSPADLIDSDDWGDESPVAPRVVRRRQTPATRESSERDHPAAQLLLSDARRAQLAGRDPGGPRADDVDDSEPPVGSAVDAEPIGDAEAERPEGVTGSFVLGQPLPPVTTSIESKVHDVVRLAVKRTFHGHYP